MNSELEMARARYLLGLISHDFQSPRILGFHGGSIETVEYIIEHGRLPGSTREKHRSYRSGDTYFYPRVSALPKSLRDLYAKRPSKTEEDMILGAVGYALMKAVDHAFCREVGWDFNDERLSDICLDMVAPPFVRLLRASERRTLHQNEKRELRELFAFHRTCGLTKQRFVEVMNMVARRKGFVFTFDRKLLHHVTLHVGDDFTYPPFPQERGDLFVRSKGGVDYRFICGLRALGSEERRFLLDLKRKFGL